MTGTKDVALKIEGYLTHRISLSELAEWAERAMMDDDFEEGNFELVRDIVGRLGAADVKNFGLTWEDCNDFLKRMGYTVQVEVVSAG